MTTKTDYTLTYLTDEEYADLKRYKIRRTYRWTRRLVSHEVQVEFELTSASYITISYNGQPLDRIDNDDYQTGRPRVRSRADMARVVADYWSDKAIIRGMIRGGLGMDCPPLPERG